MVFSSEGSHDDKIDEPIRFSRRIPVNYRMNLCLLLLFPSRCSMGLTIFKLCVQVRDINHFPMRSGVSERASERMSAAERASEATSVEEANE